MPIAAGGDLPAENGGQPTGSQSQSPSQVSGPQKTVPPPSKELDAMRTVFLENIMYHHKELLFLFD